MFCVCFGQNKQTKQALYISVTSGSAWQEAVIPLHPLVRYIGKRLSGTSENRDLYQGDLFHMEFADETKMFAV